MWRSLFLAIGIFTVIIGLECLGVEKIVMKNENAIAGQSKEMVVRDYTPFSLIGVGAVIMIYAYDLPRRMNG